MAESNHLLFELGTEELPPKSLQKLSRALLANIIEGLKKAEIKHAAGHAYATPRRLAVLIENLSAAQQDKFLEKRGPAIKAAFAEDGTPSKAAEGFARSCNTTVDQLIRMKTDKGEWLSHREHLKGSTTESLLPDIIRNSIKTLPIAKKMRWGSFSDEFVRPVHWAVLLFGNKLIKTKILNVETGKQTRGHRFLAPHTIEIDNPDEYLDKLYQQGKVVADFTQRKKIIKHAAENSAREISGTAYIEEDLLEEITALNEWPVPVTGSFDARFLSLPGEVLITTMQKNQKYFPVIDQNDKLLPNFITISNIESTCPESIVYGNERVIRPRLADAEFFWNLDRNQPLCERAAELSQIVFQKQLGTLADKTVRIEQLTDYIAQNLGRDAESSKRAALLSKTDLLTQMVGEFPSLQGIMGRYYATADGESDEVALALEEQYFPRQSGSATPSSITGQILSIADKTDTLIGIFSAGLNPTGDKDPYGLRRAAIGILRIIIENKLDLNILDLINFSMALYKHEFDREKTFKQITEFIFERMKGYSLDQGFRADEFEAVLSIKPANPLDFSQRLNAVREFRKLPEAESLSSANKRIRNILRKSETDPAKHISTLTEPAEKQLLAAATEAAEQIQPLLEKRDYKSILNRLAQLRNDVDAFFDNVMVMTDDLELRANRLGLLAIVSDQFLQIADISKLQSQ